MSHPHQQTIDFSIPRYVAYLTAGLGDTVENALSMIAGGADILEIGVPFSDPILDGPVIQQAMQASLAAGTTINDVLSACQQIKSQANVPIILFSYYNPLYQLGEDFYARAAAANIDATLVVDLPLVEQAGYLHFSAKYHLGHIQLLAPNSPAKSIEMADSKQPSFHYYACRAGTTGVKQGLPDDFAEKMQFIRHHTHHPIVGGFGISDAITARDCLAHADGFVVGSALVNAILEGRRGAALTKLTALIDPR